MLLGSKYSVEATKVSYQENGQDVDIEMEELDVERLLEVIDLDNGIRSSIHRT